MDRFLIRALIAAIGLWVADTLIDGISFDSAGWLLGAAVVLGLINAFVRPLAVILTFPITVITLGLFMLVLNAGMLALASWFLSGFHIAGFWSAFWGAIIVSLVSGIGSWFFGPKGGIEINVRRG
ncbi:MAG: phage holin family protein [Gammaproteobacteria bacterium]